MEFQIVVHDKKKVYAPGDRIEGVVLLNARSDVAASSITIYLYGRTKAKVYFGRNKYTSRSSLFNYSQRLYTGKFTFSAAKQFEWPFAFNLPLTPQGWGAELESGRGTAWQYDERSPLPPSMSCSTESLSEQFSSSVEYKLEAELTKLDSPFSLSGRGFHTTCNLALQPKRQEENPCIRNVARSHLWGAQSLRILPENRERKFTMKEKIHSVFSSKAPVSAFRIITTLPDQTIQGSPLPISVQVEHSPENSTTGCIPAIYLREISVSLTHFTSVRVIGSLGGWKHESYNYSPTIFQRKNLDLLLYDENRSSLPEAPPLDLGDIFNIRCRTAVDFITYNIELHHSLDLKIILQCADKSHTVQHTVGRFRVHSEDYDPLAIPASDPSVQPPTAAASVPPYQPAIQGTLPGISREALPRYAP